MSPDHELRDLVRKGVARMRERRAAEREIVELAGQDPEVVARQITVWCSEERGRLRRELRQRFGFSIDRGEDGYACRFEEPVRRPKSADEAARWVDVFVHAVAFEEALRAMRAAAAYHPEPDRARASVNAFLDVMRESPTLYGAIAEAGFEPAVREYAAAMLAAMGRAHLHTGHSPKVRRALSGEDWERELANAAHLAWAERDPDAPLKRPTRFRDTLPKQADGRRQKAPGPADFVNVLSRVLEGREKPAPPETGAFTLAEQERLRRAARDAAFTPQEGEVFELLVENPRITNAEIGARLGIKPGHVRVVRHNIKKALGA